MQRCEFEIYLKPTPASRPRVTKTGRVFYPKSHETYNALVHDILKKAPPFKTSNPVGVRMLFVVPPYKTSDHVTVRSDLDNLAKIPMDAMTKSERFWIDDHMVVILATAKRFTRGDEVPHTKVRIEIIEGSIEDAVDHWWQYG